MYQYNMVQKDFNGLDVSFIEKGKELWLTGEQIGIALEYEEPRIAIHKIYKRNKEELDDYSTVTKLVTVDGKKRDSRIYNEQGVMIITMLSQQPVARLFRKWAVQILKEYRYGELNLSPNSPPTLMEIDKSFQSAMRIARNAGLSGNSQILKAAQTTKNAIGVDVFEFMDIEKPKDETEPASEFYTVLDLLLEEKLIKNYCLDDSRLLIRMEEAFKSAKERLGMDFSKKDYPQIKQNSRFLKSRKKVHNRLTNMNTLNTWEFKKA